MTAPDILAWRLRNLAAHLDAEHRLGARMAADDLREAAAILDTIPTTTVYGERIPAPHTQEQAHGSPETV